MLHATNFDVVDCDEIRNSNGNRQSSKLRNSVGTHCQDARRSRSCNSEGTNYVQSVANDVGVVYSNAYLSKRATKVAIDHGETQ